MNDIQAPAPHFVSVRVCGATQSGFDQTITINASLVLTVEPAKWSPGITELTFVGGTRLYVFGDARLVLADLKAGGKA